MNFKKWILKIVRLIFFDNIMRFVDIGFYNISLNKTSHKTSYKSKL